MAYTIKSNFVGLQQEFKKETGIEASKNWEMYIQYYHAKVADTQMQVLTGLLNEFGNFRLEQNKIK
jgi:hypothetical protein